jgi:hypothetical protein
MDYHNQLLSEHWGNGFFFVYTVGFIDRGIARAAEAHEWWNRHVINIDVRFD